MNALAGDFARTVTDLHGQEGIEWLDRLPSLLAACARRWSLAILPPFEPLSYNYVAPAIRSDGAGVVLKVGFPHPELLTELAALRLYDGRGSVRLLDADPEQGILLLERLNPGTQLLALADDEQATSIAAQVMRQLWRPAPPDHPFPTVARWASGLQRLRQRFDGGVGPFPLVWVERAERLFDELLASMGEPVLLHGDLHHYNILAAERQPWLALDPKGVIGEPEYEVGALLRNPLHILSMPQPGRLLERRVAQLAAELGFDRQRLVAWAVAQAVLSAWWSFEGHGRGWERAIACAELLSALSNWRR
jgi:streptomycin 6-kinase